MRAALVNKTTKRVENVIEIEAGAKYKPAANFTLIPSETAEIGDIHLTDDLFTKGN